MRLVTGLVKDRLLVCMGQVFRTGSVARVGASQGWDVGARDQGWFWQELMRLRICLKE